MVYILIHSKVCLIYVPINEWKLRINKITILRLQKSSDIFDENFQLSSCNYSHKMLFLSFQINISSFYALIYIHSVVTYLLKSFDELICSILNDYLAIQLHGY